MRLWERICEDSQDFGRGFVVIRGNSQTLGEDSWGFKDFGRGFAGDS